MPAKHGAASGNGVLASLRAGVRHNGLVGDRGIMQLETWCTERGVKQSWVFKSLGTPNPLMVLVTLPHLKGTSPRATCRFILL